MVHRASREPDDQRDKPHHTEILNRNPAIIPAYAHEPLFAVIFTDRRYQNPAWSETVDKRHR